MSHSAEAGHAHTHTQRLYTRTPRRPRGRAMPRLAARAPCRAHPCSPMCGAGAVGAHGVRAVTVRVQGHSVWRLSAWRHSHATYARACWASSAGAPASPPHAAHTPSPRPPRSAAAPIDRREEMPARKVASATEAPVPARAATGRRRAGASARGTARATAHSSAFAPAKRPARGRAWLTRWGETWPPTNAPCQGAALPRRPRQPPRLERAPAGRGI